MESKSAETSTGASAGIVLSIIGGGYFCCFRQKLSAPPADNSRPENLTDEEWQLIQMARQEKRQASQTSSSTSSDIA
nr:MAG TPA: Glycophorin A [Caudoviricetes sp.]